MSSLSIANAAKAVEYSYSGMNALCKRGNRFGKMKTVRKGMHMYIEEEDLYDFPYEDNHHNVYHWSTSLKAFSLCDECTSYAKGLASNPCSRAKSDKTI